MPITVEQIDELKGLVTSLRDKQEKALDGVMPRADFAAFEEKIGVDISALLDRVSNLETKAQRPYVPDPVNVVDEKGRKLGVLGEPEAPVGLASDHKAFVAWVKGRATAEEIKALTTDDNANGGYLVSPQVRSGLMRALVMLSPLRDMCARETITGNALIVPIEEGGFAAGWVGERSARPDTPNATLGELRIELHEMYAKPKASQNQLDDTNFNLENWISSRVAEAFALKEGLAFLKGDGVLQPEGILTHPDITGTGKYLKNGHATNFSADAMRQLEYSIAAPYARNASFCMKRATVLQIMLTKDTTGRYLWNPPASPGASSTFDGFAIAEIEDMDEIASARFPVLFGDFRSGYQIIDKATVAMLRDPFSSKPYVEFYTTYRVGGRVLRPEAFKALKMEA